MTSIDESVMRELLLASTKELQAQRRFKFFWRSVTTVFAAGLIGMCSMATKMNVAENSDPSKPHVAVIDVHGPVASGGGADSDVLIPALDTAFYAPNTKAVILRINSPGGSPVHAGRMYQEIMALRKENPNKPVYAVIEDLSASAAYYIASAATEIYVDQASLVGSIGVITEGFGYTELMEKAGVERRVMASGVNKALLDPYLPLSDDLKTYWYGMLGELHAQFVNAVKAGRGNKLKIDETPDMFTGLVWTGERAIDIGLADAYGSVPSVARKALDGDLNTVNYTPGPDLMKAFTKATRAEFEQVIAEMNSVRIR